MSTLVEDLVILLKVNAEGVKRGIDAAEKELVRFKKIMQEQLNPDVLKGFKNTNMTLGEMKERIKANTLESKELAREYQILASAADTAFMGILSAAVRGVMGQGKQLQ